MQIGYGSRSKCLSSRRRVEDAKISQIVRAAAPRKTATPRCQYKKGGSDADKRALRERQVDAMPNAVRRERAQQFGCFYAYMRLLKVNALPVAAAGSAFAKSSRAVYTVSWCI
jgi:hypothetical protein